MPTPQEKRLLFPTAPSKAVLQNVITTELIAQIANRGGVCWPLDDAPINGQAQSYARAIHPAVAQGRENIVNGTFDADATWAKGAGWTIAGGVAVATSVGANVTLSQTLTVTVGKTYLVTYTIVTISAGSVRFELAATAPGTTRSAVGTYSEIVIAQGQSFRLNAQSTLTATIDNVSCVELNIPASLPIANVAPNSILADGDMEQQGVGAWTAANAAILTKDNTVTHSGSQSLKVSYNGTNNPAFIQSVLVSGQPYRVSGYVRSDGTVTPRVWIGGTIQFTGTNKAGYWQPFDVVGVAGSAVFTIDGFGAGAGNFFNVDDITITPMSGQSAIQLLGDNDMEQSGTAFWTANNSATLSKDSSAPHSGTQALKVTSGGLNNGYASSLLGTLVAGKIYHIAGWCKGDGTAHPIIADGAGNTLFTGTTSTSWQAFDFYVAYPNGATTGLRLFNSTTGSGQSSEFDDITVFEVPIPLQITAPFQLLADGDMEASGTAAWTAVSSATITKQSGTPHGGTQCLRIARNGASPFAASQAIMVAGKTYRAQGYCRSDGSATPIVRDNVTTIFTGTTATVWQPFDFIFVAGSTTFVLGGTGSGTQFVEFDDVTISPENGIRQDSILSTLDGNMELAGTAYWISGIAGAVTKETASPHSGTQNLKVAHNGTNNPYVYQAALVPGKTYRVSFWLRGTAASMAVLGAVSGNLSIQSSTVWQYVDYVAVAGVTNLGFQVLTTTLGQYEEIDDVVVTEISPLSALTVANPTTGVYNPAYGITGALLNGTSQYFNAYSKQYNSLINLDEGTIFGFIEWQNRADMLGAAVQSIIRAFYIAGTVNALVGITYDGSSQTVTVSRTDSVGAKTQSTTIRVGAQRFMFAMVFSLSGNYLRLFINGAQVGADVTGLNAFNVGAIDNSNAVIGAVNTTPLLPLKALIDNYAIIPVAESAAFLLAVAKAGGVA